MRACWDRRLFRRPAPNRPAVCVTHSAANPPHDLPKASPLRRHLRSLRAAQEGPLAADGRLATRSARPTYPQPCLLTLMVTPTRGRRCSSEAGLTSPLRPRRLLTGGGGQEGRGVAAGGPEGRPGRGAQPRTKHSRQKQKQRNPPAPCIFVLWKAPTTTTIDQLHCRASSTLCCSWRVGFNAYMARPRRGWTRCAAFVAGCYGMN
jgi:hypothetical protein